ncbi:MAG TPA: CDP-alcohol phosphatidyltransferase family protein [Kiloniellales bacterium]|nr:CDP-alcohol phosphatidyltransferase family protein [Kiloniellales bacterium]
MLDSFVRRLIDKPLAGIARPLAAAGLSANAVTLIGFAFGIGAAAAVLQGLYLLGLGLLLANRLADGLDGAVARASGVTDFGGYLDIVLDFLVYNALVVGFALAAPMNVVPALFLLLSFVGTGTTFLAYAILAAKRGLTHERQGRKSFYYLGGLAEGSETLLFFALACLLPQHFPLLAWIFAGVCLVTTLGRIAQARRDFG